MKLSNKSKVLALVISALMIISVFPLTASAATLSIGTVTTSEASGIVTITVPYTASADVEYVTLLAVRSKDSTGFPTFVDDAALSAEAKYVFQQEAAGNTQFVFKVSKSDFDATKGKYLAVKIGGTSISQAQPGTPQTIWTDGPTLILGDVTGEGSITGNDAAWVLQKVANASTVFPGGAAALISADVTGEGSITGNDAAWILQKVANSATVFPAANK